MRISKYRKCKSDDHCNDYNDCTTLRCINYDRYKEGICEYTKIPCDLCGTNVVMNYSTNEFADHFTWEIDSKENNRIIMSSTTTLSPHTTYNETTYLPVGDYSLVVSYLENTTQIENVSYSLLAANELISIDSKNDFFESGEFFTVCKSDNDCLDFDGYSSDFCI